MDKIKIYNLALLLFFVASYLIVQVFWSTYCVTGHCSFSLRNDILRPISEGSLYLAVILFGLLLIPSHYFKKWLKYIFSWGFPLSVYLTYITTGSNSIPAYDKVDVAQFWGMFFAVVTVIFIVVLKCLDWRQRRK